MLKGLVRGGGEGRGSKRQRRCECERNEGGEGGHYGELIVQVKVRMKVAVVGSVRATGGYNRERCWVRMKRRERRLISEQAL